MAFINKTPEKKTKVNSTKIYINTITPYFEFKNKLGRIVMPIKRCISL